MEKKRLNCFQIIPIVILAIAFLLVLMTFIPWYRESWYDYSHVTTENPTPVYHNDLVSVFYFCSHRKTALPVLLMLVFLFFGAVPSSMMFMKGNSKKMNTILLVIALVFLALAILCFAISCQLMMQQMKNNY